MTREQWTNTTPASQRIKIAELCGREHLGEWRYEILEECLTGDYHRIEYLPDYLNDLNAMHTAVDDLSLQQQCVWVKNLSKVVGTQDSSMPLDDVERAQATSAQRAEAFALTVSQDLIKESR